MLPPLFCDWNYFLLLTVLKFSLDNDGYLLTLGTSISKYRDTGFMVYNLRINTHIHRVSLRALL